ncbi:chromobox protein homolog 3-like [Sitodiplosis mosellana]|uniref:chromobox protein homolog 3-like n=1 Tax=Sitodiplosis mosellana TaxID=263140 RepID=UPI0024444E78|nr:chromobox protein homolog 3-like [Sitodiplosis mosellana]
MDPIDFVVEKILKKRINDQNESEFYIKWEGYDRRDNTWEPKENLLGCPDALADFEKTRKGIILGAKRDRIGNIWFLMKFGDVAIAEEYPANEANMFWPDSVIKFYETRLLWQQSPDGFDQASLTENIEGTDGDPQNIQYVTDVNGELLMWVQWPNGNCKWVKAKEASKAWPQLVIRYYEDRVSFDRI